jgi:hypothetical protein
MIKILENNADFGGTFRSKSSIFLLNLNIISVCEQNKHHIQNQHNKLPHIMYISAKIFFFRKNSMWYPSAVLWEDFACGPPLAHFSKKKYFG